MGKFIAVVGGPGSGKSKFLRERFLDFDGSAIFIEGRHKPSSIAYMFNELPSNKRVAYLDNLDNVAAQFDGSADLVVIDTPHISLNEALALVALSTADNLMVYAAFKSIEPGEHPYIKYLTRCGNVEVVNVG